MKNYLRHTIALLSILAASGLSACIPIDDEIETPSFDATQDTLDENLIKALCVNQSKCADEIGAAWTSVDECIEAYEVFGDLFSSGPSGMQDPSLYDFDTDLVNECLGRWADAACDGSDNAAIDTDCVDALAGKLLENECCDARDGCGPGLSCTADENATGLCLADALSTESCVSLECAEGLYCDSVHEICLAEQGLTVACLSSSECVDGLVCLDNVCAPSLLVGDACDPDGDDCPFYADCVGVEDSATCQAMGLANDSCDEDLTTASSCNMMAQIYCADSGSCVAPPGLAGDCAESFMCNSSELYCNLSLDTTTTPPHWVGVCEERIAVDESCITGYAESCISGAKCTNDICVENLEGSFPICE